MNEVALRNMRKFMIEHDTVQSQFPKQAGKFTCEGISWACFTCGTEASADDFRGEVAVDGETIMIDAVAACRRCNCYAASLIEISPGLHDYTIYQHPQAAAQAKYFEKKRRDLEL